MTQNEGAHSRHKQTSSCDVNALIGNDAILKALGIINGRLVLASFEGEGETCELEAVDGGGSATSMTLRSRSISRQKYLSSLQITIVPSDGGNDLRTLWLETVFVGSASRCESAMVDLASRFKVLAGAPLLIPHAEAA